MKTHDFPDKELGKVAPYGVYDVGGNRGWVSVGLLLVGTGLFVTKVVMTLAARPEE